MKGNGAANRSLDDRFQDEPPALDPPAPCLYLPRPTGLCCVFQARGQKLGLGRCWPLSLCIKALPSPGWIWIPSGPIEWDFAYSEPRDRRQGSMEGWGPHFGPCFLLCFGHCQAGEFVCVHVLVHVYVCVLVCA